MSKPSRPSTNRRGNTGGPASGSGGGATLDEENLRNSLRAGHSLHWYEIEGVLGQGGFGITYLAYDANLDQRVAIKEYLPMELAVREGDHSVYPASQAQDSRYRWGLERFLSEARTLARFKHPAIVRVLSVFEENNTAYMVMEYQHGDALQRILDARGSLPEPELVSLVLPLLEGLEIIHEQGFIHRDIKPSNIFIREDGLPVLLDFGSARQALGQETQTLTSVVSPGYAPFEQYYSRSDRQGPWTDIYGLGATLYRCISGLQPMAAIDRSEAILKAERDVFVTASELGAGKYSRGFLEAIDVALEFNEKKRPQTVGEWRPFFRFGDTVQTQLIEPLADGHGGDTTRFSALAGDTVELSRSQVVNPDARSGPASGRSRPRDSSRAPARRASAPPSAPRQESRSAPRSAPPATRTGTRPVPPSGRHSGRPGHSREHAVPAHVEPPRRRVWPWLVLLLAVAGGGIGYAAYLGILPFDPFAGTKVARLVAQGDRALAAGKAFGTDGQSALAYYRKAWDIDASDEDALHGLRLTGEQLFDGISAALAAGDTAQVERLAVQLALVPERVLDQTRVRAALAAARVQTAEANKQADRIDQLIAAAEADIANGDLVGSGTNNALAKFRAIQILEPDNVAAARGLDKLAATLVAQGEDALAVGDFEGAAERYEQAAQIAPAVAVVRSFGEALNTARASWQSAAERAAERRKLLDAAAADLAANRLMTPPGENALERFRRVLTLDPGNAQAEQGVRDVHDRYVALATQALAREAFDEAGRLAARAAEVRSDSQPAATLRREIAAARQRHDDAEAARLAAEAEARLAQQQALRQQQEQARRRAEEERRRQQEAEAQRLLAEAEARAAAEKAAQEAALKAELDAVNAQPRLVLDFSGFHPKYARNGLTRDGVYAAVAPLIRNAGYEIVTRGDNHDANYRWTNVRLLAYRLRISENSATGLYSYAASVLLLPQATLKLPFSAALDATPEWNRGFNGLGPPTDLRRVFDAYVDMTRAWLANQPGRRR